MTIRLDDMAIAVRDVDAALGIAARHGCHPLRGVTTDGSVDPALGARLRPLADRIDRRGERGRPLSGPGRP